MGVFVNAETIVDSTVESMLLLPVNSLDRGLSNVEPAILSVIIRNTFYNASTVNILQ